ncbi:hypothetical protein [uncultured Psychroserpens sp.]|uniref:hypothetical protein n=1 Tax=uncultured Psychroserpens sp. TaxID=255436 RepID=UPI002603DE66|nr:hypothetical protein [uncultured Psychroserpens sp.]
MEPQDSYLIQEYESAVKLTFHIDELRNKLSSIFLSLTTIFGGIVALLFENKILNNDIDQYKSLSLIMIFISVIGFIMICILGRLRKVQFEHFNIINNIRGYFIGNDDKLKEVVILNNNTLPKETLYSGSYLWSAIIMIGSSIIFAFAMHLNNFTDSQASDPNYMIGWFIVFFLVCNAAYFLLCRYTYQNK